MVLLGLWIGLCSILRPRQHSIGYMGDGFYRSKDPTNSIKVLKERWYCWVKRWYVPIGCQYKPLLYLALFGRNLWCKFWPGLVSLEFEGRGWRWVPWVARWWLPIGSAIPIVTIGLSLTIFAVLWLVTERQTELVQQKVALRTKVHRPPKINNKIVLKTIAQVSCICKIFSWSCIVWT